jgi:hypothetical protein
VNRAAKSCWRSPADRTQTGDSRSPIRMASIPTGARDRESGSRSSAGSRVSRIGSPPATRCTHKSRFVSPCRLEAYAINDPSGDNEGSVDNVASHVTRVKRGPKSIARAGARCVRAAIHEVAATARPRPPRATAARVADRRAVAAAPRRRSVPTRQAQCAHRRRPADGASDLFRDIAAAGARPTAVQTTAALSSPARAPESRRARPSSSRRQRRAGPRASRTARTRGPDVGPLVDGLPARLLRAHVRRRPEQHAGGRRTHHRRRVRQVPLA